MSATAADDARRYPFLFLGQGFGMCRKCLEGYFWFERSPTVEEQALITAAVPLPVQNVSRFDGALMHWGSDDMLPERENAVYNPAFAGMTLDEAYHHACHNAQPDAATLELVPGAEQSSFIGQLLAHTAVASEREWVSFCTAFEQATHAIHAICPLRVVLKPDDERGRVLGLWHHWSVSRASDVIAVQPPSPVTRSWSYFAANLSAHVLGAEQIAELPPAARRSWITWLAAIISDAPRELVTTLVSTFDKLVASFAESDRVQRRAVKDLLNKGSAAEIAQAIDSGQLAIERAIPTLAANRRREPGLNDVVENSRILSMIKRAHTADIGAAVAAGQISRRDLRRCAKAWEDVAEPLLRVAVLAAPLDDAERNDLLASVSELATVLQDQGRFDEAWQMVQDHLQFSRDYPPLALTAAALLVHRGELDRAIDHIEVALAHGYRSLTTIRTHEPFRPLFEHPRFRACLDAAELALRARYENNVP